jgi:hypothetical protein
MDISILGHKLNVELLILIGVVYLILVGHTVCGCCSVHGVKEALTNMFGIKEGFAGANTNYGESSQYSLNAATTPINTASWNLPNMTVTPGQPLSKGVQSVLHRPKQQIPLPEGELSMFANTAFKPECCPNTYSNSTGCACMTTGQYNYLVTRGGNNVPYSEY